MLVGVAGKARSGKDTFAKLLTQRFNIERVAFADELKLEVAIALNSVNSKPIEYYLNEFNRPETKERYRQLLQWWGTDYRRELCSKTYWIDKLDINNKSVVVPDVRFINECEFIKDNGGILVKMERPSFNIDNSSHVSEYEFEYYDKFDYIISAVTKEELILKSKKIIEDICNENV